MILVGNQRGGAKNLALHLMKDENEHVQVHQVRGFASADLEGAFQESFAMSRATKCKQHLFSLSLNPPKDAKLSATDFEETIDRAERQLGLNGQPRAIVLHTKNGRTHAHAVWSRINADKMRAVQLSFTKRKMQDLSRDLYREHGWQMPRGFVRHQERDPRNFTLAEWQQCKRAERNPAKTKEVFQDAWTISDGRAAFSNALEAHGLILAKGDRRGHVAVDHNGEAYSVSRYVGIKAKQVRDRLGTPDDLPSKNEAYKIAVDRVAERLAEIQREQARLAREQLKKLELERQEQARKQAEQVAELQQKQSEHRRQEIAKQQARIRKGIVGLLDRVTGKRKKTEARNLAERQSFEQKAELEKAALTARGKHANRNIQGKADDAQKREAYVRKELSKDTELLKSKYRDAAAEKREAFKAERRSKAFRTKRVRRCPKEPSVDY